MVASPIEAAGGGATGSSRSTPAKFCSGHIVLCVVLSLRHFGPAAMLLIIPWRGWAPRILARCCSTGASRRFFYLGNSAGGRSMALVLFEPPGRCASAPAASERAGGLCVVLSLRHFGPAAMLLII